MKMFESGRIKKIKILLLGNILTNTEKNVKFLSLKFYIFQIPKQFYCFVF